MNDETEKDGARSAIILVILVLLVAAYSVQFGLQTLISIEANHWVSQNRWLSDVPQPLRPPAAQAEGTQLKAYDYQFLAPWPGNSKMTSALNYVQFQFDSGPVIVFFDPEAQLDTLRNLKSLNPLEYQRFQNVFLDHPIESNYALYQAVYGASPAQLSPFMKGREAMRMNVLLLWKLSFGYDARPGLYSLDFGKIRGFQFGDPVSSRSVAVRVFDDRDRQFRFIFTVTLGSNAVLTQDDIGMTVQSLQPVPILER